MRTDCIAQGSPFNVLCPKGEEIQGKRDICIHVFNSLCCMTETNKKCKATIPQWEKNLCSTKLSLSFQLIFLRKIVLRKMFMCSTVSIFKCMYTGEIYTLCE